MSEVIAGLIGGWIIQVIWWQFYLPVFSGWWEIR